MNGDVSSTVDNVAVSVVAICASTGNVHILNAIEQFQTSKSDSSDAGTFSFSGPLTEPSNLAYLQESGPMDVIAIYADRATSDDLASIPENVGPLVALPASGAWGSPGAGTTKMLQSPTLVFLGVIDDLGESYTLSESSSSTLSPRGRDFTKFLIVNDVLMPYDQASVAALLTRAVAITPGTSISALMYRVLDVFVAKHGVSSVGGTVAVASALAFPWRNFISTAVQDAKPIYLPFSGTDLIFPSYQVQSGSVWANLITLKNEPLSRLFITEDGEFLVDDALAALITQSPIPFVITSDEFVENASFSRDDSSVATFISIIGAQMAGGSTGQYGDYDIMTPGSRFVSSGGGVPSYTPDETVQRFGVRAAEFTAVFYTLLGKSGSVDTPLRQKLYQLIQLLHNQLDVLTLTVKGRPVYRVGTRVQVKIGFARQAVSFATWYICNVSHSWSFGSGWTTVLTLRMPQAK